MCDGHPPTPSPHPQIYIYIFIYIYINKFKNNMSLQEFLKLFFLFAVQLKSNILYYCYWQLPITTKKQVNFPLKYSLITTSFSEGKTYFIIFHTGIIFHYKEFYVDKCFFFRQQKSCAGKLEILLD